MYEIFLRLGIVVLAMLVVGLVTIVGLDRIRRLRSSWRMRLRVGLPVLLLLLGVLAFNGIARQAVPHLSWIVGVEISDTLYLIEGSFVGSLQTVSHPALTAYFSYIYVYGYVFLLVFPLAAYFLLDSLDSFRATVWAYIFNYTLGLVCYIVFIAYGPRNIIPDLAEPLMYSSFPDYQLLTREVNRNTNVFPSLHTSLSVTALLLAYRTRSQYPRWLPVAAVLAVSVVIATMYLGIHWATDVVAGVVLAWVSVRLGIAMANRSWWNWQVPRGLSLERRG